MVKALLGAILAVVVSVTLAPAADAARPIPHKVRHAAHQMDCQWGRGDHLTAFGSNGVQCNVRGHGAGAGRYLVLRWPDAVRQIGERRPPCEPGQKRGWVAVSGKYIIEPGNLPTETQPADWDRRDMARYAARKTGWTLTSFCGAH